MILMHFLDACATAKKVVFAVILATDNVQKLTRMITSALAIEISDVFHWYIKDSIYCSIDSYKISLGNKLNR